MSIFKDEFETKRVIFNINLDVAVRLEKAKKDAKKFGKKLDVDTAVTKSVEKFIKKAEKKLVEMDAESKKGKRKRSTPAQIEHFSEKSDSSENDIEIPAANDESLEKPNEENRDPTQDEEDNDKAILSSPQPPEETAEKIEEKPMDDDDNDENRGGDDDRKTN